MFYFFLVKCFFFLYFFLKIDFNCEQKLFKALDLQTISSDFNEEKISYMLISSWFYSLTFNLFKKMIYGINDRLKLTLQKKSDYR